MSYQLKNRQHVLLADVSQLLADAISKKKSREEFSAQELSAIKDFGLYVSDNLGEVEDIDAFLAGWPRQNYQPSPLKTFKSGVPPAVGIIYFVAEPNKRWLDFSQASASELSTCDLTKFSEPQEILYDTLPNEFIRTLPKPFSDYYQRQYPHDGHPTPQARK